LRSTAIAGIARQYRLHEYIAGIGQPQPIVGTNRERGIHEPPVVPIRHVETPEAPPHALTALTDCAQCGYVYKSLETCPRCTRIAALGGEALPRIFRGR